MTWSCFNCKEIQKRSRTKRQVCGKPQDDSDRQWEAAEGGTKQEDTPEAADRSGREPAETQDQYPTWTDLVPEGKRKFDGYVSQDALDNKRWRFEFDPAVQLNTDDLDLML